MSATAPTAEPEAIRISRASMLLAYVTGAYGFSYSVMLYLIGRGAGALSLDRFIGMR